MKTSGFTRAELLALLAVLSLLGTIAASSLAAGRPESDRATCFNNLRRIGRAVGQWGSEHGDQPPWLTRTLDGGTRPATGTKPGNAWFEFLTLSNELATPRILACPADSKAKVASDWSNFASASFRGSALSYHLGLHSNAEHPEAMLAADLNLRFDGATTCGPAAVAAMSIQPGLGSVTRWTNEIHGLAGHWLAVDGSVRFLNATELNAAFSSSATSDNGVHHFLRAR